MLSALIVSLFIQAASANTDDEQNLYQTCRSKVTNANYGSADWEYTCTNNFDMAKPYLIKCLNYVKNGFPDKTDRMGCQKLCETNKNWGPWYDFELPNELKILFFEMKRRHDHGKCYE